MIPGTYSVTFLGGGKNIFGEWHLLTSLCIWLVKCYSC